jgi:hypothetical protein
MAYTPFDLMDSLLGADTTARQAYKLIMPVLVEVGMVTVCTPFIEFLTMAMVRPIHTGDTPITVQTQAGLAGYVPSPAVISFRPDHILYRDAGPMTTDHILE